MKFRETETQSDREFAAMLVKMCGERTDAAVWAGQCVELATHWDHITDGDPVDVERFGQTLRSILLAWPRNRFYVEHAAMLAPVLLNAILAWESSDLDPVARIKAYDVATEIPTAVAFCLGGENLAREWSPRFRAWAMARCKMNDGKE